jgi:alpha-tubulin suppressor-like RCC1 family protein
LVKVAAGLYNTAVVMSDGTVRIFGRNNFGQLGLNDTTNRLTPVQVSGLTSATTVACGLYQTVVLLADGTVRTFGQNNHGQLGIDIAGGSRLTPVTVLNITSAAAVGSGRWLTGVVLVDGTVRAFGRNHFGQLGVNDTTSRQTPVQVFGISSSATAVSSGEYFTAVLLSNGTVRMFGLNNEGQLGLNDTTSRLTPVQVFGISSSAIAVSCGQYQTAVLLADGTVRTFGRNTQGQLGINVTGGSRLTPVQVLNITSATAVACGFTHTSVLLADGTVRTFGENVGGQLGVGDTTNRSTPVQVFGISSSATAIAGGFRNTIVLLADGTVRTVGGNGSGQLGVADTVNRLIPVKVGVSGNKVAGGLYHTAVISNDGTVRTFGSNDSGELGVGNTTSRLTPVQVTGLTSAIATACGGYGSTAVLLNDGTVRTFGSNNNGQLGVNDTTNRLTPVTVLNITSATVVACGYYHMAFLLADGTVRTTGSSQFGQLGININTSRLTPVQVFGISSSAVAVACGAWHTAVLLANGTVQTLGRNTEGQLGVNDTTSRQTPVQVWGISSSATAVACGYYFTTVLLADGTVRTFGNNSYGQLGVNDTTQRNTPVQVWGISSSAVDVACGGNHTAVLLAGGTVLKFGDNYSGVLGLNDTASRLTPVQVTGLTSVSGIATGGQMKHSAILLQDGTVRTFGFNNKGQLGVNDTTSRLTPVQVIAAAAVSALGKVAGGASHTAVVLANGTVSIFGRNQYGQLGINDTTQRNTPVQVWGISSSAVAVACVSTHTIVLLADGTVRAFGENTSGQLGVNDTTSRLTPVQVWGISSSATAIACGVAHTAILLADGTVRTFGSGGQGRLGVGDTTQRNTPVQVLNITSATAISCGAYHTVVLLTDGTVRTFGNGAAGQLGVNDTTQRLTPVQVWGISSSAVAVAGGQSHTVVLLADGTVRTFGVNFRGELGVNDKIQRNTPVQVWGISSSAVAIAAGVPNQAYFTAIVLADGTLRTFGRNNNGQLGINDTIDRSTPVQVLNITSATAIACGSYHIAALLADGTVRTFGSNDAGQLGVNDTTSRQTPVQVLNITTAVTPAPTAFLTNATAIVTPLTSAAPLTAVYLSSAAQSLNSAFVFNGPVFTSNIGLGRVPDINYQLDMSTDGARKTFSSTWTTGSDIRIKSDVVTANLARCAEIVDSLDLKYFKWNFPEGQQPPSDAHSLGWIAQDVQQFFPKSVETSGDFGLGDFHSLNSDQLVKVLWGALKHTLNEHFPTQQ